MAEGVQNNGGTASTGAPAETTQPAATTTSQPDWLEAIPEEHRSNPRSYIERLNQEREWADYGRKIAPHHKTFEQVQQDWNDYQTWKRSQSSGNQGNTRQPSGQPNYSVQLTPDEVDDIDWGDPEAVKQAFRKLKQDVRGHVDQFTNEITNVRGEFDESNRAIFEMMKITQEIQDIRDRELYGHVQFTPQTQRQELAQYMLDHRINDAKEAYEQLYGRRELEKKVQLTEAEKEKLYAQAKADAEQTLANRTVTTETSSGTPWRRQVEGRSTLPANSPERKQQILDRMAQVAGVPRELVE